MICFDALYWGGAKRVFNFAPFGRLANDDGFTAAWVVKMSFKYGPIGDPPYRFNHETVIRLGQSIVENKTAANEFEIRFVWIIVRTGD